jgi:hypothetical protein
MEQWWLIREQWWLIREQWWLIHGAVVAHSWSSGGSLVATPECETAVLGSNPAISPAYSGLPFLKWAAIWDGASLSAVHLGAAEENIDSRDFCSTKKQLRKKKYINNSHNPFTWLIVRGCELLPLLAPCSESTAPLLGPSPHSTSLLLSGY